jgi:ribosomal-protein-alanine N-acetyltransferase
MENTNSTEIVTPRFRLRSPSPSDSYFFTRLYSNSEVMRHIPPCGKTVSTEEAHSRLGKLLVHWQKYGYGMFVVEDRENGQPVGYCGFRFLEEVGKIELGYIIDQTSWGKGVAYEAAEGCVQFARTVLKTDSLVSVTSPANLGSQRILSKLGFTRNPGLDGVYHGMKHIFFCKSFSDPISTA